MIAQALLVSGSEAQRAARSILAEGRFHQPSIPHPLHGVLVALGRVVASPLSALEKLIRSLARDFPGGLAGLWIALALMVVLLSLTLARRRARGALAWGSGMRAADAPKRAEDLERAALRAERGGDLDDAVRLRFRAGLIGLSERDRIGSAQTTPTSEVSKALHSERFDALAHRFDEIAYGSSPATLADIEGQKQAWPQILRESAPR